MPAAKQPDPDVFPEPPDGVTYFPENQWSLVDAGAWEISVGPDGLLTLPRSLIPEEVSAFIASATLAARWGAQVREWNQQHILPVPELTGVPPKAIVTEIGTPPPPGTVPMTVTSGPNQPAPTGSIGRRKRAAVNPSVNPAAMPGMPRNARRR